MSTKVLIAEDHRIVREGVRALLDRENGIEVIGEARDGHEAVRLARKLSPNVVVMDVMMPILNGIEATRQIIGNDANVKVIALSARSDKSFVSQMLCAGASGYLLKNHGCSHLVKAIHSATSSDIHLSPEVASVVVKDYLHCLVSDIRSASSVLSSREREVLQLMSEGHSTKQIALRLHISVQTVSTHRRQIMKKLELDSVAELTKFAVREGLTCLDS